MDKLERFKRLWNEQRFAINRHLVGCVEAERHGTDYFILSALNLLLEVKERALFPQDFM